MIQEFYNKLSEKEKKVFYVAFAFVILAIFDLLFFRPVTSRIKSLDEEVEEKSNSIKRDVRFLAYKEKIMQERDIYEKYKTDETQAEEEIIASFLKTVETLASQANVNLVKLNPADSTKKKGYMEYYANLECNGRLENLVKFMHSIDLTDNLLRIVKIDMTGKKSSADEVQATMKVAKLVIDPQSVGDVQLAGGEENPDLPKGILPVSGGGQGKAQGSSGAKKNKGPAGAGGASNSLEQGSAGGGGAAGGGSGGDGNSGGGGGSDNSPSPSGPGGGGSPAGGGSGGGGGGGNPDGGAPQNVYPGASGPSSKGVKAIVDDGKSSDINLGSPGSGGVSRGSKTAVAPVPNSKDEEKQEEKPSGPKKEKTELQKKFDSTRQGGRAKVEGFESLVYRFFHGGKLPESDEDVGEGDPSSSEGEPNLWERKMQRK